MERTSELMHKVTNIPIQMSYFVRDIDGALRQYNRLRWHRSVDGPNGTFVACTDTTATIASLPVPNKGPHALNGTTLSLQINGLIPVGVTFSDPDPVTTLQAITAINTATSFVVAVADPEDSDRFILTTPDAGTGASISILEGTANQTLGLAVGDGATGADEDTTLLLGVHEYFYTDRNSDEGNWYKVQFLNTQTAEESHLSVPFPVDQADRVTSASTIVGYVRIADMSGGPIEGRKVTLFNSFLPNKVEGFGIFRHSVTLETDRNGYAEVRLIRGMSLDLSVTGTGFVRRITIPTTGDAVDLLDPTLVINDEFGIQQADVDFAFRTS